ncbi:TraR/DksA C4-type zinc finger protein [uncultured Metabacillus sp.]|uniref:TraR/DksA family transcriptional regulator n=1 Tax=uncultured Metabacillus sp. TaxID=2860135 RepID=UPI00262FDC86|nr:TraR/DksA C4-type zinc finger protein [uncultured Metabacillus sp.]
MLTKEELKYFENKLLTIKQGIIDELESNHQLSLDIYGELSSYDNQFADTATELDEQEKQMMLYESSQKLLEDVNEALERIKNGTYGICIDTGEPISIYRLDALPYAKRTMEAQKKYEEETNLKHDQEERYIELDADNDMRIDKELQQKHGNSSH